MQLVNMKLSPDEQREYTSPTACGGEAPAYPWGLCLSVDDDALGKLGLPALPMVGQTMMLMARVTVQRVEESQTPQKRHRSLSLQITDMAIGPDHQESSAEQKLYGAQG